MKGKKNTASQSSARARWDSLNTCSDLVFLLYAHKDSGGLEDPARKLRHNEQNQASPQRLQSLKRDGLIDIYSNKWELDQTVIDFIDSLSGVSGEANVLTILGNKNNLVHSIQHYLDEKEDGTDSTNWFNVIHRDIKKILKNVHSCLEDISYNIRDTYVSETNLRIKVDVLNENLEKLDELEKALRGDPVNGDYEGIKDFIANHAAFNDENDERMLALKTFFLSVFPQIYDKRKISVELKIRDYLDRIERIDKPARKIQVISQLYFAGTLHSFSNIEKHEQNRRQRIVSPRRLKLSLENDIQPDEHRKMLEAVARSINLETGEGMKPAPEFSRETIHRQAPSSVAYNYLGEIRRVFKVYCDTASPDTLLAKFIIEDYDGYEKDMSFREKVMFFLETVNQFRTKLEIMKTGTEYSLGEDAYWCVDVKQKTK